jgi:glutamate carboxypeptidase
MFNADNLRSYITDLEKLVMVDSPTNHKEGIHKMINLLVERVGHLDLHMSEEHCNEESGPCLLITNVKDVVNSEEKIDILYLCHMDTVYEVGTAKKRGFRVEHTPEGKLAYGPGVIDNKGGVLMGIYALNLMDLSNLKFAFLVNSNEETGSEGNKDLIVTLAKKSRYSLILEPARVDGSLVDSRIGKARHRLSIKVKNQENITQNPLYTLSNFILHFNKLNNERKQAKLDYKILKSNLEGIYVDDKNLEVDIISTFASNSFIKDIEKSFDAFKNNEKFLENELSLNLEKFYPALELNSDSKRLKFTIEAIGKQMGFEITWQTSLGGSDGCFTSEVDCATIDGLGPIGGCFHTEQEYINLDSVTQRCNLLINLTKRIVETKEKIRGQ